MPSARRAFLFGAFPQGNVFFLRGNLRIHPTIIGTGCSVRGTLCNNSNVLSFCTKVHKAGTKAHKESIENLL